jgi:hypothetical protein
MSPGSKHYAPLYNKITKAIYAMAAHQVSSDQDPFSALFSFYPRCHQDRRSGLVRLEKEIALRVAVFLFIYWIIHF